MLAEAPNGGAAPYPPSGWKPQGARLSLPSSFRSRYEAPADLYGPPPPPTTTTTEAAETTTTELPTTTETSTEEGEGSADAETGVYYVLLPDGRLQKVSYSNARAAALKAAAPASAVITYQDVEPIRAPVYQYNTQPLIRIFKKK